MLFSRSVHALRRPPWLFTSLCYYLFVICSLFFSVFIYSAANSLAVYSLFCSFFHPFSVMLPIYTIYYHNLHHYILFSVSNNQFTALISVKHSIILCFLLFSLSFTIFDFFLIVSNPVSSPLLSVLCLYSQCCYLFSITSSMFSTPHVIFILSWLILSSLACYSSSLYCFAIDVVCQQLKLLISLLSLFVLCF